MKFVEYVEFRDTDSLEYSVALVQEVLSNENYNPSGVRYTDEQLHEVLGKIWDMGKQALGGLWGMAKTAASDFGRAAQNLPSQLAAKGQEFGTSYKMNAKLTKAQDLLNALSKVEQALTKDPEILKSLESEFTLGTHSTEDSIANLRHSLEHYLSDIKGRQSEFEAQRKDKSGVRTGPATTDPTTRLPGHDERDAARRAAEDAAERARRLKP